MLSGKVTLETLDAVHRQEMKDAAVHGFVGKGTQVLARFQRDYRRRLADLSGAPYPTPASISMFNSSISALSADVTKSRELQYAVLGDGPVDWHVFENGQEVKGRDWCTNTSDLGLFQE